ncbi:HD domain-containing protein [Geovibrio thiophilus]|uniref:HD domain-containing protein n=1 Tax=Geovibrio thiophilus TaxID=139438 RepID=A0A410JXG4_9BACT|nr:HD domain-containing phosphohydrolase [Geovibrio thiophilus]QAR32854.1 HD domain-containing protein [Geovibrio thiophilus]
MPELLYTPKPEPTAEELVASIFSYIGLIANEHRLDQMLVILADMGRDLVVADRCTVWLIDRRWDILWTKVAHGVDRISIPLGSGIAGKAAENDEEIIINDAYSDPRFDKTVDMQTGYHTRNMIAIPYHDPDGNVIGVFQAINKMTEEGNFTEEDVRRLMLAATYTGKELSTVLMQQEIERTQKEIIFTMAEAGEMRSKETGFHVKRVAEYSYLLAIGCGMSEKEAELLKMASPMHDIGKVAIPDSILLKPGKLTDEEWEVMRSHAVMGYNILRHSERKILKAAATVALTHHEKWNGKGYPNRLAGEDIHIFGRITAIADVFDALGSDRVYKKAWELEKILNLLKEESGQHFDPSLVKVFFDNLDKFIAVRDTYKDMPGEGH